MDLASQLRAVALRARAAARPLARSSAAQRTAAIAAIAEGLDGAAAAVLEANRRDVEAAQTRRLAAPLLDRLRLTPARLTALGAAVRDIAAQPDPVGAVSRHSVMPNGLQVQRVRLPLGVVLMIYESRPNVTVDAAALCLRSGNAAILRGGSEAAHTNAALAAVVEAAASAAGLGDAVQRLPTQARGAIDLLLQHDDCIDLVIPRGGAALVRHVVASSRIPVLRHDRGLCHVFVERSAALPMAQAIVENSKVQRPGVCNAMETLLVDRPLLESFLPGCLAALTAQGVEVRGCAATVAHLPHVRAATEADWDSEFLDLVLAVRVVDGLDGAIGHIDRHGTHHTAAIVTEDAAAAARFAREVDTSCVMINASTRFNDGGALGLGAEMGISTSRLHAYGPMGAEALTTERFVVHGRGQVRPG